MNLYLSGPMTGKPDWNTPAFDEAATEFRSMGHAVFNPAEADRASPRLEWVEYMQRDLPMILSGEFDALILLPGWWESRGARLEVFTAWSVGIPLVDRHSRRLITFQQNGNFLLWSLGEAFELAA